MQVSDTDPLLFDKNPDFSDWEPSQSELEFALELNTLNSFRLQFRRLKTRFSSFESIVNATFNDLAHFSGWAEFRRKRYLEKVSDLKFGQELKKLPKDITILTYFDSRYPTQLRELYDPPPVLYVKGDLNFDYSTSVAIVGTRNVSDQGVSVVENFAWQLSSWGLTIISGGARGIDSIAHKTALDAKSNTIAVLGCGLDVIFPAENKALFKRICESGAMVSEFPMGTPPEKYNFPARNRIIAGLSRGTLVVEAPEKSGALITAELALQINREIFAIPGRITDGRSVGTNLLIRDGAHIALEPSDIPVRFGLTLLEGDAQPEENVQVTLSGDEKKLYSVISLEAKDIDQLVDETGIPTSKLMSTILILQTRGLVKELPGSRFVRPVRHQ